MSHLPTGTITFLFTDIEGSTKLWEQHPNAMRLALARHDVLLRHAIEDYDGFVFKTVGDAFCAAFSTAPAALAAALAVQQAAAAEPWPEPIRISARIALHTGAAEERGGDYFGPPLNRVARLLAAGHGGQVLLSLATHILVRDVLPPAATLLHLGEHRLRDLGRPEAVFQLAHPDLPSNFPPLRSLDHPDLPNNLPQQTTSFIGREREVAEVKSLMGHTRLLTLTGSGGSGKSRLSLQVAADLLTGDGGGVWLVELAPLDDPALVPQAVADVLGVREEAGRPISRTLAEALRSKRLLLVLDNCEHLLSACALLVSDLLRACPDVRVLASSREALGVAGEQTYRVPSLSLPDSQGAQTADILSQFEAVRLFIERAKLVQPSFAVTDANAPAVAQVCWRLDGIPLAIELAAARVRAMPVEQVMARLDDRFTLLTGGSRTALPRQQTLRALIDWSYDLLTGTEKTLLRRLSVFGGGWTLETAERVCSGGGVEGFEVLDLLTGLVDKSLVVYEEQPGGGARYRLLGTMRQYARDRLIETGEAEAVRGRHLDEFARVLGETSPQDLPNMAEWLRRVEGEHDNFRAALDWGLTLAPNDTSTATRVIAMTQVLWLFWTTRALFREGRTYAAAALSANAAARQSEAGNAGLVTTALLHSGDGDHAAACLLLEERLSWCHEHGDDGGVIHALYNYSWVRSRMGDWVRVQELAEECLARVERAQAAGSVPVERLRYQRTAVLSNLAAALDAQGDTEAALRLHREQIAVMREEGRTDWIAGGLVAIGLLLLRPWAGRDLDAATIHLNEGLTLHADLGSKEGIMEGIFGLGMAAGGHRAWARSARLLGAAAGLRQKYGLAALPVWRQEEEANCAAARAALGAEAFAEAWAEGEAMTLEEAVIYALKGNLKEGRQERRTR